MAKSKDTNDSKQTTIVDYLRCTFPALAVESHEERRLMHSLLDLTRQKSFSDLRVVTISATQRLIDARNGELLQNGCSYPLAFKWAAEHENTLLVVMDFQHIIPNGGAYRSLKDQFETMKANGSTVILVAPTWQLPAELQHDIPVIDFALPTRDQLAAALDRVASDAKKPTLTGSDRVDCLDAMAGLTLQEAEDACALSLSKTNGQFDPALISGEKVRLIRSSGLLELAPLAAVEPGGLSELYSYVDEEVIPVKDDPLLQCRGIILVGIQGGGKSLSAKAIGARMRRPVLKMNFGSLKGGIVGASESNIKRALKLADAVAPCVLWVDEVEKGVGGYASSDRSDGGVTSSMIGIWLEWLQEHETAVFTVATCNDFSKLPTELTRAGRFDERFFVDLPIDVERAEIAEVHLKRYTGSAELSLVDAIVPVSESWTGAEIEQLIKSATRRSGGKLTKKILETCAAAIRPISKVKEQEISDLRSWASNALRPANTKASGPSTGRRFREA